MCVCVYVCIYIHIYKIFGNGFVSRSIIVKEKHEYSSRVLLIILIKESING